MNRRIAKLTRGQWGLTAIVVVTAATALPPKPATTENQQRTIIDIIHRDGFSHICSIKTIDNEQAGTPPSKSLSPRHVVAVAAAPF